MLMKHGNVVVPVEDRRFAYAVDEAGAPQMRRRLDPKVLGPLNEGFLVWAVVLWIASLMGAAVFIPSMP